MLPAEKKNSVLFGFSVLFWKQSSKINDMNNEYVWDVFWILWPKFFSWLDFHYVPSILVEKMDSNEKYILMLMEN